MLLFRAEGHVARSGQPWGASMSLQQMWQLADVWYHDRADPAWRRKTGEEASRILDSIGLRGDFWRLT